MAAGRAHTICFLSLEERSCFMYVTYSDLFAFVMVLIAVATFFNSDNNRHKK